MPEDRYLRGSVSTDRGLTQEPIVDRTYAPQAPQQMQQMTPLDLIHQKIVEKIGYDPMVFDVNSKFMEGRRGIFTNLFGQHKQLEDLTPEEGAQLFKVQGMYHNYLKGKKQEGMTQYEFLYNQIKDMSLMRTREERVDLAEEKATFYKDKFEYKQKMDALKEGRDVKKHEVDIRKKEQTIDLKETEEKRKTQKFKWEEAEIKRDETRWEWDQVNQDLKEQKKELDLATGIAKARRDELIEARRVKKDQREIQRFERVEKEAKGKVERAEGRYNLAKRKAQLAEEKHKFAAQASDRAEKKYQMDVEKFDIKKGQDTREERRKDIKLGVQVGKYDMAKKRLKMAEETHDKKMTKMDLEIKYLPQKALLDSIKETRAAAKEERAKRKEVRDIAKVARLEEEAKKKEKIIKERELRANKYYVIAAAREKRLAAAAAKKQTKKGITPTEERSRAKLVAQTEDLILQNMNDETIQPHMDLFNQYAEKPYMYFFEEKKKWYGKKLELQKFDLPMYGGRQVLAAEIYSTARTKRIPIAEVIKRIFEKE